MSCRTPEQIHVDIVAVEKQERSYRQEDASLTTLAEAAGRRADLWHELLGALPGDAPAWVVDAVIEAAFAARQTQSDYARLADRFAATEHAAWTECENCGAPLTDDAEFPALVPYCSQGCREVLEDDSNDADAGEG